MQVLINANAGSSGEVDLDILRALPGIDLIEVDGSEETLEAAANAAHAGVDLVVAAGGDGTVHTVANGLMRAGTTAETRPALGIFPLGTGNDFARTLCLPLGAPPTELLDVLRRGARRTMDLIHVSHPGAEPCYAINVCAGGFSGAVDEALTSEMKETWGPLAYLVGAAKVLPDLTGHETCLAWDGGPEEHMDAFNVVVANGRTAGGGRPVAPRANPEDGLLDVVVIRQGTGLDIARLAARVLAGDYLDDEHVVFNRVERLTVTSHPGMWFNVDGELRTNEPVTFQIAPHALRVVVGPDYTAAAPTA